MLKVIIQKEKKQIKKVSISGHAGYAKEGYDIVCAAVSSVVTTSVNGILCLEDTIEVLDDTKTLCINLLKHTNITDKLIANMIALLEEIEKQYKKYINIRTEEKNEC